MSDSEERSASGIPLLRHREKERNVEVAEGDEALDAAVTAHLTQHVGEPGEVWHELVSPSAHIDVHTVPASADRPFHLLMTAGMSSRPMKTPPGAEGNEYAEIVLALPKDWPLTREAFAEERNYWPMRWLKQLARLPHEFDTWLWYGHTVPNGDPPRPFADDTQLCGFILIPPLGAPKGFDAFPHPRGGIIRVMQAFPLHREEMDLKLAKGTEALVNALDEQGIPFVLDKKRPNAAVRRASGLFGFLRRS